MRRISTRRSGSQKIDSSHASDLTLSGRSVSKEMERMDQLFYVYADKSSGYIGPEGIESFCSDMDISHTDVRILMLAWKMKAERQGYFSLEEWRRGLRALRADTISKIKKAVADLEKEVRSSKKFIDFYSFAFRYCLTEDRQKSIDIESACELLKIVMGSQFSSQIEKLTTYIMCQHDYKVISMDQWMGFLNFCNEINFPSLDNYDSTLAWPLILDNFVEWMLEKQS